MQIFTTVFDIGQEDKTVPTARHYGLHPPISTVASNVIPAAERSSSLHPLLLIQGALFHVQRIVC